MRVEEVSVTATDGETTLIAVEKRLSARERAEPEAAARLRAEALLLDLLGGRVTPRLVGAGDDERGPWLRTEKLAFPTLADRMERASFTALDPHWIERATRAAFAALAELHEANDAEGPLLIVHADLSPANLAVDDAGSRAALLDLELACWRGGAMRDGAFRGTIAYAAPEVARGEVPTVQSDLFALAATLLHAMIGLPPRRGFGFAAMLATAAERPVFEAPHLAHVTHVEIASRGDAHAAIVRCLAHDPGERPSSAREVLGLLR